MGWSHGSKKKAQFLSETTSPFTCPLKGFTHMVSTQNFMLSGVGKLKIGKLAFAVGANLQIYIFLDGLLFAN